MGRQRRESTCTPEVDGRSSSGLASALFTKTQQRVLSLLFGQPKRSFFTSELIDLVNSGTGAVHRELTRLVESGLVKTWKLGNQKHYQANEESPIFDVLCLLVKRTLGVAFEIRSTLETIRSDIELALIFGSVAKGTDTAASDIDVLVVSDELTLRDLYSVLEMAEQRLGRRISPTLFNHDEFLRRGKTANPFLEKVLSGSTIPLIGKVDEDTSA